MQIHEIEGAFNVRWTTLDLWLKLEYDYAGNMEIVAMRVYGELISEWRRGYKIPSPRFIKRFRDEKFDWLYNQCVESKYPF